ncbi:hypothetical protein NLI96_g11481 [Meripilus lineatus]|uniref:ATP-dependent DNA helicase n=1 Tax=Meripilus lineatus TaxID=2056292 RepID=A0AAD5URR4_9APHY|nr:hypothetical protein NLI96_g11481 [Physisporinus lineatus]
MEQAKQVLHETFGLSSYRLSQEAVIRRLLLDEENALVLYPTGGGKSLTYQLPALCLEGLTLVISPLISLMKDQTDRLRKLGVEADNLDSTLTPEQAIEVKQRVENGTTKLLYVAPERLNNEGFMELMTRVKIALLAVDESHCIAQWGATFRPDYLKIARFAEELDVGRVLCLTATATISDAEDICTKFHIAPAGVFRTPFYRSNLAFKVEVANSLEAKIAKILPLLEARTGPAIIYVTLKKQTDEVADLLSESGLQAWTYHAGMNRDERGNVQDKFMASEKGIVCATIAFGMGIDKGLPSLPPEVVGKLQPRSCDDIPTLEGFARGETCSESSLQSWMREVAAKAPVIEGGQEIIEFNLYRQAKDYDIRPTALSVLYAQLELDYKHIRATTPFYSNYDLTGTNEQNWLRVLNDGTPVAQAIRNYWKLRPIKDWSATLDVVVASQYSNIERSMLAKKIVDWELAGLIITKPSQVRYRYQVVEPLPKDPTNIGNLANLMHQRMLEREDKEIKKIKKVIDFATGRQCLAAALALYYGDDNAVPGGACGICTVCLSGSAVAFYPTADAVPDPFLVQTILEVCHVRDDPRLLARMAFGITSPRLTDNGWTKNHLFGCMPSVDFNALVLAFDSECKKVGYQNAEPTWSPPETSRKRTYDQANSGSSYSQRAQYRGNRGTNKRARGSYYYSRR